MARNVDDLALLFGVLAVHHEGDPMSRAWDEVGDLATEIQAPSKALRVAWSPDLGGLPVEADVAAVLDEFMKVAESLGWHVEEDEPDFSGADECFLTLRAWAFANSPIGTLAPAELEKLKPTVQLEVAEGKALSASEVAAALAHLKVLWQRSCNFFSDIDLMIAPVTQLSPFPVTEEFPAQVAGQDMVEDRAVQGLLRDVGPNWFDVLIDGRLQNFFKEETVKVRTDEVAPNRELIRRATQDRLSNSLEPFSIEITELLIVNVQFSPEYMQSIEDKQIATQNALRSVEEVAITRAEADKERARARGVSDATVIEAEGVSAANQLIAESLSPEVLQYLAIIEFNDNVTIALVPSGEGLLLDASSFVESGVAGANTPANPLGGAINQNDG